MSAALRPWRMSDAPSLAACVLVPVEEWVLHELGLSRLEHGHRMTNLASCRVSMSAGLRAEGVARARLPNGAERFDGETHAGPRTGPAPVVGLAPVGIGESVRRLGRLR